MHTNRIPNYLPAHLREDVFGLEKLLRDLERQHEHDRALEVCDALMQLCAWGPVLRFAERLTERAEPRVDNLPAGTPPPWSPAGLHVYTGDAPLARHAYNAARLVAPLAGESMSPQPGGSVLTVPNPLDLVVRALRVWWPLGFLHLLHDLVGWESLWRTDLGCTALQFGDGANEHLVRQDGGVEAGLQAPPLEALPECVCLRGDGRRGVCPICHGKPVPRGEMCVCVAGRCPRCGTGPKLTRENKGWVLSSYGHLITD